MLSKNLFIGMHDPEVRSLQQLLNVDADTIVSESGAGSAGFETDFFGKATLAAVIRFQEKYPVEVLVPAGLNAGTGFVGKLTREKLLRIRTVNIEASAPEPTTTKNKGVATTTQKSATVSTEQALRKYGNDLATAILAYTKSIETYKIGHLLVDTINSPSQEKIDSLGAFAKTVDSFAKKVSSISLEQEASSVTEIHKKISESYATQADTLNSIWSGRSGTTITAESMMRYNDTVIENAKVLIALMQFFKDKGIRFGAGEAGVIFNRP
ncbi:MAG: hypothetical protein WCO79_00210 [bacterium]